MPVENSGFSSTYHLVMTHDPLDLYEATRDELVDQLRSLSDTDAAASVPGCPAWSVKDVVAHVCGLTADIQNRVTPPLGSDENTARQVSSRAHMTLAAVCDEWQSNTAAIDMLRAIDPPLPLGLLADLTVHVHDIAEAADGISVPNRTATEESCGRYAPLLQERLAENADVALTIALGHRPWEPTAGTHPVRVEADAAEFLCAVTGRRTRAQTEAFTWTGADVDLQASVLDNFTQYGPFRTA